MLSLGRRRGRGRGHGVAFRREFHRRDRRGTIPVNRIAKWDGAAWDNLGTGVNTSGGVVKALVSHDDGHGQALFAGGEFSSAGDTVVSSLARWNGSGWARVGGDFMNPPTSIDALAVFNASLYAGGLFDLAGGTWARNLARWNGTSWFAVGTTPTTLVQRVTSLAAHDDGFGAKLYAGGDSGMSRWSGSSWTAVGGGARGTVLALASVDDGTGPTLFAGGQVTSFVDSGDSFLGKWGCDRLPPVISAPPVNVIDRPESGPGEIVFFTVTATDDYDPAPSIWLSMPSGSAFPFGTTMVTCVATDAAGNQSSTQFPVTLQLDTRSRKL